MSKMQRDKGKVGEREAAIIAREFFPEAGRNGDARQVEGDLAGIPGCFVSVKFHANLKIPTWTRELEAACPPDKLPILTYRRNNDTTWRASLAWEDLCRLLADWPPVKEKR